MRNTKLILAPLVASLILLLASNARCDAAKTIRVYIALCDNKTQGIIPVGERIGDGNQPDDNLYWGCSEGFAHVFPKSKHWRVLEQKKDVSHVIMRRMKLRRIGAEQELIVEAYRGSEMKQCLIDFEQAVASGRHDLVAYIGHNGLMDFELPEAKPPKKNKTEVVVLCCLSERYFAPRLQRLGARPILLTRQLMYPASSLLHEVIEERTNGGSLSDVRLSAAKAYAANQSISIKAAAGIFAILEEKPPGDQP